MRIAFCMTSLALSVVRLSTVKSGTVVKLVPVAA
jgi:hypothetical protein